MPKPTNQQTISLKIDTTSLSPDQIRLLNALYHSIYHTVVAQNEEEFFNGSAESMRMCASLIKQSSFGQKRDIPYSQQALEYSLEILREYIDASKLVTYDH